MATGDKMGHDPNDSYSWGWDHDKSRPVEPSIGVRSFTREGHLRRGKVLRKSLGALDHLLGEDGWRINGQLASGRRAISELVVGTLDNWSWGYACIAGQHSSDAFAVSIAFRLALEEWVLGGTDSRKQLQVILCEFIAALDTERLEGQG